MKILIDSLSKRMTVPLIRELKNNNYQVHGICKKTEKNLSRNKVDKVFFVDYKKNPKKQLEKIFSNYSSHDILIFGNPVNIKILDLIKPDINYLSPSQILVKRVTNKSNLNIIAKSLGIKVPKESNEKYPMIIKLKNSENTSLKPNERYRIIRNKEDFHQSQNFINKNNKNLIFQEYVEGESFGVSMLMDHKSNMLDYIVHKRILEYPISGGPSSLCSTVENHLLVESTKKLLEHIKWKGFAMVEYKGDYLIEINPRFWGSMPLIFKSKSSFFKNYINYLLNEPLINQDKIPYKLNVKMNYFPQGLISIFSLLKNKYWSKSFKGFMGILGSREGIFSLKDPKPFILYLLGLFRRNL